MELDEAYKDHKAAGLQEGRFHVSFGDLNEWLGRMRKPSIERAAMTGVRSHERAPSSPTSDPSLPGSMRRTSVVQMDKINIFKARDGADVKVTICVKINKCVGCNATQLTESSVERPTPPRH